MRRAILWQAIIYLSSLAALVVTLGDLGPPLRPLVIFWFLLIIPGMGLVPLLRLRNPVAEWTLAIALSLALEAVLAGAMVVTGLWFPQVGLVVLIAISVAGASLQVALAAGLAATMRQARGALWQAVAPLGAALAARLRPTPGAVAAPRPASPSRGWPVLAVNLALLLLVASQLGRGKPSMAVGNVSATQPRTAGPTQPAPTETVAATFESESAGLVEEATLVAELSATPPGTDTPLPSLTPTAGDANTASPPTPTTGGVTNPTALPPTVAATTTPPLGAPTSTTPVVVVATNTSPPGNPSATTPPTGPTATNTTTAVSSPTATVGPSASPTRTPVRTATLPATATRTPTLVPSATRTPTPVPSATRTPTLPPTATWTATATPSVTPAPTATTPAPPPTDTASPVPSDTAVPLPTDTEVPLPTDTPTATPTVVVPVFWTLSGQIKGGGNDDGLAPAGDDEDHVGGVTIQVSNGSSTSSDSAGNYAISGLLPSTYSLTPSKDNCDFSPPSRTVLLVAGNVSGLDFRIRCPDDDDRAGTRRAAYR